jgi:hypothetical protein
MRKRVEDEVVSKAKRRELKKRPRMKVHGAALKRVQPYGGKTITKQ